jgi:hypothetical protein
MTVKVTLEFASTVLAAAFLSSLNGGVAASVSHEAPAPIIDPVAILGDKVCDFLRNDQSGFEWRSAAAIAKSLDVSTGEVETAAKSNRELSTRMSTRSGMGLLISLA